MESLDAVVIGAGVVGLAVARALAVRGREVVVVEAENQLGTHASSRNSEVIHAGIYYPHGSLKAQTCVAGRELLYRFCAEHGIKHRRVGKLLVAAEPAEIETLMNYCRRGWQNGVLDLRLLQPAEWCRMEPDIDVVAAAFSPSTGIIDSHGLMLGLLGEIERHHGTLVCNSPVSEGESRGGEVCLRIGGATNAWFRGKTVINCAGMRAPDVALGLGVSGIAVPRARYARGRYYALAGKSPFRHLVYPMPQHGGLGLHVTLDLAGQARFGPDVRWIDSIDYSFEDCVEHEFRQTVARYYPGIQSRDIHPSYCGIRAKITGPSEPEADFLIQGSEQHGIDGLINLFGFDSPGLTAALAVAELVADRLAR